MSEINNPHDSFFRETFSRKEVACDFLTNYLPETILKHIDLETLMSKDTFVDQELRHHLSDLLYSVTHTQGDLYLYLLFEHKSSKDNWVALQLLRYMLRIWELHRKQHPKKKFLPIILPLVLYHGRTTWQIPKNFGALFDNNDKALKQYSPNFQFILHDFSHFSDEEIRGQAIARVTMLAFKYIFDPHLTDKLPAILNLLKQVNSQQTALEILETLLRYVVTATKRYDEEDVIKILGHISMGDDIMKTFIDTYIEQGKKQGVQLGVQQGIHQTGNKILGTQLTQRFGTVPEWVSIKINNADLDLLEKWSLRILSAENIDDIFH